VRLRKRHYFGLAPGEWLFLGAVLWPVPLFLAYAAKIELAKIIYIEGYSPPKTFKYFDKIPFNVRDEFFAFESPDLKQGMSIQSAKEFLMQDGFQPVPAAQSEHARLGQNEAVFRASWTGAACVYIIKVVLPSSSDGKLEAVKGNFSEAGCL
jgi:hypothetical protein